MIKNSVQWLSMALFNNKSALGFFEPLLQKPFSFYTANNYRAKLLAIRDEITGFYTLQLKVGHRWKGFKAGQFVELIVEQNGSKVSRFFSISSPPKLFRSRGIIEITIQKQNQGRITPWLCNALKLGQHINISSARGEFCLNTNSKPLLLIAAGSGITPFKSMLTDSPHESDVHLIYYAKYSQHLFVDELKTLDKTNKHITVTIINSSEMGRFSLNHLLTKCPDFNQRQIYICGPGAMIESSKQLLLTNNVDKDDIHYEYFGAKPVKNLNIKNSTGVVSFNKSSLEVTSTKNTLLELAESSGLKPNTGCRMGICHQCICQKTQGIVYNTKTNQYSDTGHEEVQLCVSVPVGNVSINL